MDKVTPYVSCETGEHNFKGYEKVQDNDQAGLSKHAFSYIKDMFNKSVCIQKKFFYGDTFLHRMPKYDSKIIHLAIDDEIPVATSAIYKRGNRSFKFQTHVLNPIELAALKGIIYNFVIENYRERDTKSMIYGNYKAIHGYVNYFFMIEVHNWDWLIEETKNQWKDIMSSSLLVGEETIKTHYDSMRPFYYEIVKKEKHIKSIYKFFEDNAHLTGHIFPSIYGKVKHHNHMVMKYVRLHLQKCYQKKDFSLRFNKEDIDPNDIYYDKDIEVDASNAIFCDVTIQLLDQTIRESELNILKKSIVELIQDKKTLTNEVIKEVDDTDIASTPDIEYIKYLPTENKCEDIFYYGLPDDSSTVIQHLDVAMKRTIACEDDIDDIDYIQSFPFKRSYKIDTFRVLKQKNDTIRISPLTLNYICLYMYMCQLASIRAGHRDMDSLKKKRLEMARDFAKLNITKLRENLNDLHKKGKNCPSGNYIQVYLEFNTFNRMCDASSLICAMVEYRSLKWEYMKQSHIILKQIYNTSRTYLY
uniref:p55 C-terminal domain-containing protein n=1 Tax=Emaravirus fici TaxID=1980427 RepID=A0A481U900_9VIRU|nr:hypothetical protein [Emaravirus fici]